jgi:hypothetical protein
MHIRTEISDRIVTTVDSGAYNTFVTTVDQITETGLLWLQASYKIGEENALRRHEGIVKRIADEGIIHYCSCGETARQYSGIAGQYLCGTCWDINVGERR